MVWITPANLAVALLAITLARLVHNAVMARRRARGLLELARERNLNFMSQDRFSLATRLPAWLPVPGAAAANVRDVLYGTIPAGRIYVCELQYTVGAVRMRHRNGRVMSLVETADGSLPVVAIADPSLALIEQYRSLLTLQNPRTAKQDARPETSLQPGVYSLSDAMGPAVDPSADLPTAD